MSDEKEGYIMFKIGDKIAYPMHGAGIIDGVEERNILGENHQYYVLRLALGNVKVMVPVSNISTIGVRYIVSEKEADDVITSFVEYQEDEEEGNWNKRYRENVEILKEGNLMEVARIVKLLILKDRRKSLSNAERKMLTNAKSSLFSELGLSKDMDYKSVEEILMEKITG